MYDAVERFCARHPRFGIPNLMRYIVIGNVVVYFLSMLSRNTDAAALDFLAFNLNSLLHGEIWRIVTYIFVPEYSSPFAAAHRPVFLLLDRLDPGAGMGNT